MRPRLKPGDKFGSLVVLKHEPRRGWKCQCDCGRIVYKASSWLTPTSSCMACYHKKRGWKKTAGFGDL